MSRMVQCVKLGKQAEGLERQPYPGELGKRIFEMRQQTMLINEYRLSPVNPKHREMLEQEMDKFFFSGGSTKPEGYVPPSK